MFKTVDHHDHQNWISHYFKIVYIWIYFPMTGRRPVHLNEMLKPSGATLKDPSRPRGPHLLAAPKTAGVSFPLVSLPLSPRDCCCPFWVVWNCFGWNMQNPRLKQSHKRPFRGPENSWLFSSLYGRGIRYISLIKFIVWMTGPELANCISVGFYSHLHLSRCEWVWMGANFQSPEMRMGANECEWKFRPRVRMAVKPWLALPPPSPEERLTEWVFFSSEWLADWLTRFWADDPWLRGWGLGEGVCYWGCSHDKLPTRAAGTNGPFGCFFSDGHWPF